jgi:aldehyde dehydrogenase (NAD+)
MAQISSPPVEPNVPAAATAASQVATAASQVVERLRQSFTTGRTRPLAWREVQLQQLRAMLVEREDEFCQALADDLGKCKVEAWTSEVGFVQAEALAARKSLRHWMRPRRVGTSLVALPGASRIVPEPLGVVLILAPWNYPLNLALAPLVGALAAGNCALIKPSEQAPHTSAALARLVPQYLDPQCVAVLEGDAQAAEALLAERFDHIFYTGGAAAARKVMEAAARNLTPVTLELGGKSPCLVLHDADLAVAARRIAWAKFLNAGQTCVAPDYVLVDRRREADLLAALRDTLRSFYGDNPRQSADYGRIVNARHFERLVKLLGSSGSGEIVCGGEHDAASRYIAPTILHNVPLEAPVMQEEIFGPLLPVLAVDDLREAIDLVNARPKPLALYLFSRDKAAQRLVLEQTTSGAMCINDAVLHFAVRELPFGGVGTSGMGAYHGRHSFDRFSHSKAVLVRSNWLDLAMRYPPYTAAKFRWLKRLLG